jgi:tetratricopeptide (TPR) repeat protein
VLVVLWLIFAATSITGILNSPGDFERIDFDFKGSTRNALFLSFSLVFVFVLFLFFGIFITRFYLAELSHHQSKDVALSFDKRRELISKAITLNHRRAEYYLAGATNNLAQLDKEIQEKGLDKIDQQLLQNLIAGAVNLSKVAVDLKPNSAAVWEQRGLILESTERFIPEVRDFIIQAFERAVSLEPTNSVLLYKLGENERIKWADLVAADAASAGKSQDSPAQESAKQNLLQKAKEHLDKAVKSKSDYFAPRLSLARLAETENNLDEAIKQVADGLQFTGNQNDAEAWYELGRFVYNKALNGGKSGALNKDVLQESLSYIDRAIVLLPNYSNALYTRALINQQLDNLGDAVKDMKKVVELNPGNKEAETKLKEMERRREPAPAPTLPIPMP